MLLFAFILESGLHNLVFSSPAGPAIRNNIWLYALDGGFMAGLFEETGRYLAFAFALKKYRAKNVNALMYGAGHGGFEAIVITGFTMINNITWSLMINNGSISTLLGSLSGDQLAQAQRENVGLQNQLNMATLRESQTAQNAFIQQGFANEVDQLYNRLNSCPVPSTPVYGKTPIFTCGGNGCGCGGAFAA